MGRCVPAGFAVAQGGPFLRQPKAKSRAGSFIAAEQTATRWAQPWDKTGTRGKVKLDNLFIYNDLDMAEGGIRTAAGC